MTFGALILAISLWLFVISNNTYNMVVDMPIEARNLSAQHALNKEVPKVAKVYGVPPVVNKSIPALVSDT